MKCPYIIKSHWHMQSNKFNSDNPEYLDRIVEAEGWNHIECLKEECGVWCEDRCNYNKTV